MTIFYQTSVEGNGRLVILEYQEPQEHFDHTQIISVLLLAFDNEGRVLTVTRNKDIDIPSGPVEWDDDTYIDTARRIAFEDLSVELNEAVLSTLIISRNKDINSSASYMPVVTAQVKLVRPFTPTKEFKRRVFMDTNSFLGKWRISKREDIFRLLEKAQTTLLQLQRESQSYLGKHS
jgi:hypothetical protein